jgi:DNA-binding IclR family transcriptional regulator
MHNRVGLRAPAHLTGCGKAALALLPPAEVAARVEAVCAAESRHLPDLADLARELDGARRAGFVVSDTFQPGRTSVAAPIPDPAGAPAGGISVAGPTPLLARSRLDRIRDQVMDAAGLIGRRLAGPGR